VSDENHNNPDVGRHPRRRGACGRHDRTDGRLVALVRAGARLEKGKLVERPDESADEIGGSASRVTRRSPGDYSSAEDLAEHLPSYG